MLEFKHFITESYRKFQRLQVDHLRPCVPENVWITHNFMKWFDGYDHYAMSEDLDIASWDWYVGTGHNDYRSSGVLHDLVRDVIHAPDRTRARANANPHFPPSPPAILEVETPLIFDLIVRIGTQIEPNGELKNPAITLYNYKEGKKTPLE